MTLCFDCNLVSNHSKRASQDAISLNRHNILDGFTVFDGFSRWSGPGNTVCDDETVISKVFIKCVLEIES